MCMLAFGLVLSLQDVFYLSSSILELLHFDFPPLSMTES